MRPLPFHPIANLFPLMEGAEFTALVQDIQEHGQQEPIALYEGKVLDGRNRYRACEQLGIEPLIRDLGSDGVIDPLAYVVSLNLHRRHLNESQRAVVAAKMANMQHGGDRGANQYQEWQSPNFDLANITAQQAADTVNVSRAQVFNAAHIITHHPERVAEIESGQKSINRVNRDIKEKEQQEKIEQAVEKINEAASEHLGSVCEIRHCSMEELLSSGIEPDVVVTDPPYGKDYLHVYGKLAQLCKGIPLVAVICGQSYLPEVLHAMCAHLTYRWTLAYLTPGGQAVQQWERKIETFWKPVLLFGEPQQWIGDVCRSNPNDNDKRFHEWGQSESGMESLLSRVTQPGQLVCDPFVGGGTTAVVCLRLGRRFIGCDADNQSVQTAGKRVMAEYARG